MSLPPYWKRGAIYGLVVGLSLHLLLRELQARTPEMPLGNMATERSQPHHRKTTPLGPLLGVTIFVLFCVMPGSRPEPRPR